MFEKSDEELAEEYAVENWEFYEEGQTDYKALKEAYLAGLKAGRPKWHKVADGDLPKDEKEYLVIYESDHTKYIGLESYYLDTKEWSTICKIIAWKEIVLPDETGK